MKKILTLLLALWMLTGCVAMAAGNQLVVGSTTAMSGAFFTDLFGSNTADIDVRALLHGYNLMSWDHETGTYQINDSVVAGMAVSRDAQNNRVYTFDLYGDLKFSDGSAITAKDYAFSILLTASPELAKLGGQSAAVGAILGMDAYQSGKSSVLRGVRLLSETFVHDATTERMDTWPAHAHTPYIYDNCVGYGYQIWMCRPEGSYRADGAFGQFSVVVPSLDLIVSINEAGFLGELMGHADLHLLKEGENHPIHGPQATLNALFDILVPQIHADVETLPVGRAAAMLKERLRRLAVPHPYPNGADFSAHDLDITLVPKEGKLTFGVLYSRRKQRVAYPGADNMRLRTHDGKLEITWTEDGEQRALTADLQGARTAGELVYRYDREIITKTSSSAWWDEQGRLQMSVLWVESEAENRYMFTFDGDEVRVDKWFPFGTFKGLEKAECVYRRA